MRGNWFVSLASSLVIASVAINVQALAELRETGTQMHLAAFDRDSEVDYDHHDANPHQHSHGHGQKHHDHDEKPATSSHTHKHRHGPGEPEHEHGHVDLCLFGPATIQVSFGTHLETLGTPPRAIKSLSLPNDRIPASRSLSSPFRPPIA